MAAKPFRITEQPGKPGHTDGERASRDASDHAPRPSDEAQPAGAKPWPPAVADKGRGPGAKPFRVG